ncbi:unnamed protein product [Sphagnum troendelagicum]|uniref:BAH domain-containing protein n=1 Tax=Sphagnum troendelagicum TaxID=128251 RepID=A0ABP0THK9_9BRYO
MHGRIKCGGRCGTKRYALIPLYQGPPSPPPPPQTPPPLKSIRYVDTYEVACPPARKHLPSARGQRLSPLDCKQAVMVRPARGDGFLRTGDRTLHIGDTALFQAGNAPPFIGILRKVSVEEEKEDQVKLSVNWLYRPADVKLAKGVVLEAAPNEIFYSFHKDDIPAASLLHPCKVAFLQKGVELPSGVSSFVCRRFYDTASKCLWWLTDRDYTDEHQEEVDLLLDRTKLEMQAASSQSGGASPRALTGPNIPSSPQLQASVEGVQQNALYSLPAAGKGKKRERADQNSDPSKTEHNVKFDDPDTSTLKRERSMKYDKIATILDKDGGLLNVGVVEHLVQLMRNDLLQDGGRKVADVVAHRTMLAGVIAATENSECLNQFVHLGGLCSLDDWLQEAHKAKIGGDGGSLKECDKLVEDLLLALLRALDRLPVDLKALKTCYVGKSVNHLRSHKNVDIQKKARKLVDVWKKRVDAEMNASSEAKPGSAGHGISWSYNKLPTELGHPLTKIGSGEVLEVAVKSSGAFAGNAKVAVNGANSAADAAVIKPLSVPPVSSKTASVQSPDLPTLKDSNSSKLPALSISPDMVTNPVKEEKSSSSSHTPSNGHSWGSAAAGKGGGNIAWKEDVKASVALSVNGGSSKTSSAGSPRLPNTKDLSGAAVSVGSKEVGGGGKPMVWSRSASTTEKAIVSAALPGTSSSAQRLIVRIPNPGKSPVGTSGGTADAAAPVSRSSSPSVLERHSSTGLADVLETKNTHQAESLAAFSPEEAGTNIKGGNGVKSGTGCSEDKSTVAPVNALECEKRTSTESAAHEKVGVKQESDSISKETLTSGCSSAAFRGAREGSSPQVGDGGKDANGTSAADSVEDRPPRHSQVSPMEVDDGAMSLLASAAAEVERQGSVSPSDANREADSLSVEQRGGGGERTEKKLIVQEGAGQACEASSNTPSTLMSMAEPAVERRRAIEASFPEEDVLEVARQAANEIEQMQENSKPVSSSSSERDGQNAQTAGSPTGGEMKDVTTADTASKGQQQGSLTGAVSQPVGNSAATHNSHGDSTTPQQPVEGARHGGGDAAVSGSEASERPDFDLNEGFAGEDGPQDDDPITMPHSSSSALQIAQSATHPIASASGVAAPIAVLAVTKGAFIPPTSPMWIKGELGWKGSAATSAFRPAEPRRTPDRQHSGAESLASDANLSLNANPVKRPRPLLEFDLNVADDRVMEDIGVAVTTLSSQGSVLEISGYGRTTRPNLDLDLNRMDDSEECRMMPFSSDARVAEGVGSLAPSNNSTSKPPARRVMDFDLNDGPSFEEVGVDEPPTLQSLPARKLAGNAPMPVPMSGLRMEGGEAMNFSPWFTPTGNPFAGVSSIPAFAPGRVPDPGYSVPPAAAGAAAANSFLNAGSAAATAMNPFNGEIFRGGPTLSASPAVVYPPPGERVAFGAHGPFPVFGGSPGYLPSSVPFSGSFMDVSGGPVPFPSQFGGQPTVNSSTYIRPPLLMGMTEAVVAADNSGGTWSRRSLDLNAGPEVIDTDIARDDLMHGRLPLLHPGNSAAFNDQMRVKLAQVSGNASLTTPLKRKEPEGGWNCYTGSGGYKQSTWR